MRAMSGKLVTDREYEELARQKSVADVVNSLKKFPSYQKLFSRENDLDIHRGRVEALFRHSIYDDFTRIYLFSGIRQRKFLDIYFIRYEIAILKNCLRMIFDNRDVTLDLSEYREFFEKRSSLDIILLSGSKNISEFVENLKGSQFYPVLKRLENASKATLFDYENALDIFYGKKQWTEYRKVLKKQDYEVIVKVAGSKIELGNIQWIYRAKKYYRMTPADIYAFVVPVHYKVRREEFKKLVEAADIEEFEKLLDKCYYAKFAEDLDGQSIESIYNYLLKLIHSANIRRFPYSIACIEDYLYKKELEVDKLTTLIESVRYGLSPDEIMKYIA